MKKKYKLTSSDMILRDDGTYIPPSIYNGDYRDYEQWLSQGNTPDPADPPTEEQLIDAILLNVQLYLDRTIQETGYDNITSCITYINSSVQKWSQEAQAALQWRDGCWNKTFQIINSGSPYPSPETVISQLPPLIWPN